MIKGTLYTLTRNSDIKTLLHVWEVGNVFPQTSGVSDNWVPLWGAPRRMTRFWGVYSGYPIWGNTHVSVVILEDA